MMIPSADLGTRPSSVRALSQSVENPSKPCKMFEHWAGADGLTN